MTVRENAWFQAQGQSCPYNVLAVHPYFSTSLVCSVESNCYSTQQQRLPNGSAHHVVCLTAQPDVTQSYH